MVQQVAPTKGNFISTKKTLSLSTMGYDLLDRKRNILIRELMQLMQRARTLRHAINTECEQAYRALRRANITLGVVEDIAKTVPTDDGVTLRFRSVMGVDIPLVQYEEPPQSIHYGMLRSNSCLDDAYCRFCRVKALTAQLAEVENSVYRLAAATVKTQRRANALRNVVIPRLQDTTKWIADSLEEKDREEFSRLKVIKANKNKDGA